MHITAAATGNRNLELSTTEQPHYLEFSTAEQPDYSGARMSDGGSSGSSRSASGDEAEGAGGESKSAMRKRHHKQLKELQAHWKNALKKAKGKAKKDLQDEADKAEADLIARQAAELAAVSGAAAPKPAVAPIVELRPAGPTKAQKAFAKKQAAESARIRANEAELAALGPSQGALEEQAIAERLARDGLAIMQIQPDGHCMYKAVCVQLGRPVDEYALVRAAVASHIRSHRDEFVPFLLTDEGDLMNAEQVEAYCEAIERTATWGGHVELVALASVYRRPIVVYTADELLRFGDGDGSPICLTFHRYLLGLGEHYNSAVQAGRPS